MSAIYIQGEIVHYEALGRGRPIIFLHSWVGSWRYWIASMQASSQMFRTYALDLWGFGDTAKNINRYTLNNQVELIESFKQALGIDKVALVGHGLGALIAILFANRHPDQVDRVMTVGIPLDERLINPRLKEEKPEELAYWLLDNASDSVISHVEAPKTDQEAIIQSLNIFPNDNPLTLLSFLGIPSLLVFGQEDQAIQTPTIQELGTLPMHIHMIIFENSGHFPMIKEARKFNRLMLDFFALESGESPKIIKIREEWKRRIR